MFVPVTTKPFLNSVNFKVLQWVSLHYFSLIKEKTNRHITSCLRNYLIYKLQHIVVSDAWVADPASLYFGDNSTNASNFTSFVFSESH
jgi:hypothetical protein